MIAPFPLLFFGGEISVFVEEGYEMVAVDDFIKFKSPKRIANLVKVGINLSWIGNNTYCYTSQLKYVFRLEENVSRAMGQNSLTP